GRRRDAQRSRAGCPGGPTPRLRVLVLRCRPCVGRRLTSVGGVRGGGLQVARGGRPRSSRAERIIAPDRGPPQCSRGVWSHGGPRPVPVLVGPGGAPGEAPAPGRTGGPALVAAGVPRRRHGLLGRGPPPWEDVHRLGPPAGGGCPAGRRVPDHRPVLGRRRPMARPPPSASGD